MEHHNFISTLIFSAINFIIFLIIVYKFVLPRLLEAVEKKSIETLHELLKSEKELEEAKRIYEQAELNRKRAEEETEKIKKDFENYSKTEYSRILREAENFAKKKTEDLEKLINIRINEARIIIQHELIDLVVKLASEKIKKSKTSADVERFLEEIKGKIERMSRT